MGDELFELQLPSLAEHLATARSFAAAALIAGLWFVLPLSRQLEDESGSDD